MLLTNLDENLIVGVEKGQIFQVDLLYENILDTVLS